MWHCWPVWGQAAQLRHRSIRHGMQEPIAENVKVYDKYYQVYKDLYYALKDNYLRIAEITRELS